MNLDPIIQNSLPLKIHQFICARFAVIVKNSFFAQLFSSLLNVGRNVVNQSRAIKWFLNPSSTLDEFFADSLLMKSLKNMSFSFFSWFYSMVILFFKDGLFYNFAKGLREDWSSKSIRVPAWILFGFVSFYASLELLWGRGFSREQMLYIFITLALLWVLSMVSIPSWWFTRHSRWVRFFKELIS